MILDVVSNLKLSLQLKVHVHVWSLMWWATCTLSCYHQPQCNQASIFIARRNIRWSQQLLRPHTSLTEIQQTGKSNVSGRKKQQHNGGCCSHEDFNNDNQQKMITTMKKLQSLEQKMILTMEKLQCIRKRYKRAYKWNHSADLEH